VGDATVRGWCGAHITQAAAACTGNRAIFASGSPFPDVRGADGEVVMRCNQSNNFYIFPGVGLGAVVRCVGRPTT
jgi:malate dehydrogenase (decarboxylating)